MPTDEDVLVQHMQKLRDELTEAEIAHARDVRHLARQVEMLSAALRERDEQHRQQIAALRSRRVIRLLRRIDRLKQRALQRSAAASSGPVEFAQSEDHPWSVRRTTPQDLALRLLNSEISEIASNDLADAIGSSEISLMLLQSAARKGREAVAKRLGEAFLDSYPGIVDPDFVAQLCSALREVGDHQVRAIILPAALTRWQAHFGLAFEAAALADNYREPAEANRLWRLAQGLLTNEHGTDIAATVAQRIRATAADTPREHAKGELLDPLRIGDYGIWIRKNEDHSTDAYFAWREQQSEPAKALRFSIIVPVFNPNIEHLVAALDSVVHQWHANLELILSDDGSDNPWLTDKRITVLLRDPRIVVLRSDKNLGIAAATNRGIDVATGDWIAFMDQDDLLAPDAFSHVAAAVTSNERARLVYSDEDALDEQGRRLDPYFKPEVVAELLLGQNVINHLAAYQAGLLAELRGLRGDFDGAQDWDLNLRAFEIIGDDEIVHIARVLYHWRRGPATFSTTRVLETHSSGRRAILEALDRRGLTGVPTPVHKGSWFQIRLTTTAPHPTASIIIPTRDHPELIKECVESVLAFTKYPNFDIIVVDNGSSDPVALQFLRQISQTSNVRVTRQHAPFNFSRLLNSGVSTSDADVVVSLNNDVIVHQSDWLEQLVANAIRPGVGAVGARLVYPDMSVQHAGVLLGIGGVAGHLAQGHDALNPGYFGQAILQREVEGVTGAVLAVRRATFWAVGGFNEVDLAVTFNDVDFCLRLRERGFANIICAGVQLTHYESKSRGSDASPSNRNRFARECQFMIESWGGRDGIIRDRIKNRNFDSYVGYSLLSTDNKN